MNILSLPVNYWIQIILLIVLLGLCLRPFGSYMASVYSGQAFLPLHKIETAIYKIMGITSDKQMNWREYASVLLVFHLVGFIVLFGLLNFQNILPTGHDFPVLSPDLAFNITVSFLTNTNWQSYVPETTLSPVSQMLGLTVQNFLSASAGLAVLMVLIRGFAQRNTSEIGNFWVDMIRGNLYILLPLAVISSVFLSSQGVVQSFNTVIEVPLLQTDNANNITMQKIATGLASSQIAIKQIGTNGGGFFNANAAHPFENPTPLSNFVQLFMILLIPTSLCYTFGKMVGNVRQGMVILAAMTIIFVPLMLTSVSYEQLGNPILNNVGVSQIQDDMQSGGNLEGKETRFGTFHSALWASVTTATSSGSVNASHDSFTPMGGFVPMLFMKFGEVIFGGAGSGLYCMLIFVILSVFIAGLMVGRTPEYLGKKISVFEMKVCSFVILLPSVLILFGTALSISVPAGYEMVLNIKAQGFSEILYALTSASNNNGSAFGGLNSNNVFYNTLLGLCMLIGRFWIIVPILAIAGSLSGKNTVPTSAGTLPTDTVLFTFILAGIVVLIGVLTFVPALGLGPVAEYFNSIQ